MGGTPLLDCDVAHARSEQMIVVTRRRFHDEFVREFRAITVQDAAPHAPENRKCVAVFANQLDYSIGQRGVVVGGFKSEVQRRYDESVSAP